MSAEPRSGMTHMRREIDEIPAAVHRLLADSDGELARAGSELRRAKPKFIATVARGTSDHAAAFLKYAIELVAGVPVASIGPSVMSIYGRELTFANCAALMISQSGKSPDSVAMAQSARRNGALCIAITNTAGSPLAAAADHAIDMQAGPERSVAATKTFVSSIVAGLVLLAHWTDNERLMTALANLPDALDEAARCDWAPLAHALRDSRSLYVLGRGPALAIAAEAALKFKETCAIHAEAYSAAEVLHGPARLVENGFPLLALAARDAAEASIVETVDQLSARGAAGFVTSGKSAAAQRLPFVPTGHPITDPLPLIVTFYGFVEALSRSKGFDPDHPPHLTKVTQTV